MPPSVEQKRAAEQLKAEGNQLFQKAKYAPAIERYTEAITLWPTVPVLYVNRAMCHKKRSDWDRVLEDCLKALEFDREHMKAHYLLGVAYRETHQLRPGEGSTVRLQDSVRHLTKALESAREQNDVIKHDIWQELAKAKYTLWEIEARVRKAEHLMLKRQLHELLTFKRQQQAQSQDDNLEAWERLFAMASKVDCPAEVPSLFTCPLTMEVYRDPTITPSGQSYERAALQEHLRKVGQFDPITRQAVFEQQLITNVGLRSAIHNYLDEHPWAWADCT